MRLGELVEPKPRLSLGPKFFYQAEENVEVNVDSSERSASVARTRPKDQVTRELRLNVQGLHQHLKDPPPPRGTTLGGLAR